MMLMPAMLFISRAGLSVSLLLFTVAACWHSHPREQLNRFLATPVLWGMSLLFWVPLLSGAWSEDSSSWMESVQIKLPLLIFPLAFAAPFRFSRKQWDWIGFFFIGLISAGVAWSLYHYTTDMSGINASYLRAQSIRTPLENDHVRFSWLVSLAALGCGGWVWKADSNRWKKVLIAALGLGMLLYLHLLATRTGLISFYLGVLFLAAWMLFGKFRRRQGWVLILVSLLVSGFAYWAFPSLRNRVSYFRYEWEFVRHREYLPGSNDGVRLISLQAGWELMNQHPAIGVGFGDIMPATRDWYALHYPSMIEEDKIFPSGEWMMYGAGAGWPGFFVFSLSMLIPFFSSRRMDPGWWILCGTAALSFIADIGLEVQFGIFIYAWILLTRWKQYETENN